MSLGSTFSSPGFNLEEKFASIDFYLYHFWMLFRIRAGAGRICEEDGMFTLNASIAAAQRLTWGQLSWLLLNTPTTKGHHLSATSDHGGTILIPIDHIQPKFSPLTLKMQISRRALTKNS